jgi:hypothetical protein
MSCHSITPHFAPVIDPSLRTGITTMLVAASRSAALRDPAGPDEGPGLVGDVGVRLQRCLQKQFDLFGVLFLSFVVAVVGGMARDLLIGAVSPIAIIDIHYFVVSIVDGLITFWWYPRMATLQRRILLFDAVRLAFFAVIGAQKAME